MEPAQPGQLAGIAIAKSGKELAMVVLSLLDVAGHVDFDADVRLDRIAQQSRKPRKVIPAAGANDLTRGNSACSSTTALNLKISRISFDRRDVTA